MGEAITGRNGGGVTAMNQLLHRFTVEDYHRMGEAGVFPEGVRVELIKGRIVDMSPVGRAHIAMIVRLNGLLTTAVGGRATVSVQNPVRLDDGSEPQPDFALLGLGAAALDAPMPSAADAMLLVEVADSSLAYDLDDKAALYAESGVREYWVVKLAERVVVVHRHPEGGCYRDVQPIGPAGTLTVEALEGVVLAGADIWAARNGAG